MTLDKSVGVSIPVAIMLGNDKAVAQPTLDYLIGNIAAPKRRALLIFSRSWLSADAKSCANRKTGNCCERHFAWWNHTIRLPSTPLCCCLSICIAFGLCRRVTRIIQCAGTEYSGRFFTMRPSGAFTLSKRIGGHDNPSQNLSLFFSLPTGMGR